jgi:formate-dependent nitrite reductase cytochrome c552 subunit
LLALRTFHNIGLETVPKLSQSWWHGLFIIAAIAGASALTLISLRDFRREAQPPENRPIKSQVAGYVSSNACQACHPGNYASWHASFHRTMTQVATPASLPANMDKLELEFDSREYQVERRGDNFFARKRPHGGSYGDAQQVVLVTGSHTLQIPWLETGEGRTLEQFPFAYIVAEKMWAPVSETFLIPPDLKEYYSIGAWNGACMDCHVTQGQSRFVQGNKWDSRVAEFGIACEACHSEGREHIERNRNPIRRFKIHLTTKSDASVTNPQRLKAVNAGLACGQCHSVWAFNNMTDKIDFNRHGAAFRPGQDDLAQRFVVQPNAPDHGEQKDFIRRTEPDFFTNRFWGDGMIRVTGREFNGVQASPCFRGGEFSCLSCHEMHPDRPTSASLKTWARHGQLKPKMDSDQACLQCHKDMSARLVAHTHHSAESPGSRCYNCHMPHTTFGLLHAMRSHQVSSPTVQESVAHGRPNACNLCHLDQTLAWTAQKLHTWYNQSVPELSHDNQTIAAAVQWLVKGDAGQRALIAWGMGWESAQKTASRDWLYPYLIYTLTDSYAAVRFDAWKSLQTLPGFSSFSFTYTAADHSLSEAATRAYEKWLGEIRDANAVYRPETAIDSDGRFRSDVFQRLRSERDNKPIILAE